MKSDFGIIGLAVMGENFALNIESRGYRVSVYNRTTAKVENFIKGVAAGRNFFGAMSIEDFCDSLAAPRKIMIMVKAGEAVDSTIETLLPYLSKGDIIIDGGNSNYVETERRVKALDIKGLLFVGSGVSGGELGALRGPSLMPGGNKEAWPAIKPIFEAATAKVGKGQEPCCTWVGSGGAGHFVKMVHNGIEYGDMQVICEGYDLMHKLLLLPINEIADLFSSWNEGRMKSYLIEITADILRYQENGRPLIELILDTAGQKGTGKWTAMNALDEGIPLNFIAEAVFARCISAQRGLREELSKSLCTAQPVKSEITPQEVEAAIYASKLISYAQGFELITTKSGLKNWRVDPAALARIWRGGCIIRSVFLDEIAQAYSTGELQTLMLSEFYLGTLPESIKSLRKVVAAAALAAVPVPSMSAALSYYDSVTSKNLPANLLQAQRDYFGAHTYERADKPRGEFFHTNWTGEGGDTVSTEYNR